MKLVKIMGHPVTVMSVFVLILISGKQFGGFYLLYLIMGLPHGAPHAILAIAGLVAMFIGYNVHPQKARIIKSLIYFLACLFMVLALFTFFTASNGYNDDTFRQAIPLMTLAVWGICVLSNIFLSIFLLIKLPPKRSQPVGASI